jgi:ABC-type bacteriocin/lantibiotic exporter with double-glycine peptidase domain
MFDLAVFANPAQLKRDFLATTEVAPQQIPDELQIEFDQIQEENPDVLMSGHFWWDFVRTYKKHLSLLVAGRGVMTLLILASVLASERILDATNTMTAALWLVVFYAVVQLVMKVINAWTSVLQSQLLVCTRTFVTLRLNAKLLRMGTLSSDEFSTGNLKTLISSDIYRIGDLFHAIFRNGVPCLLGLVILGPVIVYYMGWPGVIAMLVSFGAMPLAFILGGYIHRKEEIIKAEEDKLATIIGEWVSNARLLRFLSWEGLMRNRVASHIRKLVVEATKEHAVVLVNFGISVSWWLFPIIALIWSSQLMGGNDSLVALFASIWMLNHITLYIRWLPNIFIDYALAAACVKRLNKLFQHSDITDDLLPHWHQSVAKADPLRLHLNNVGYAYEGGDEVLHSLYLSLDLKRHTSLIGKVGSGKSTLLRLLCGEIKPTSGRIQVEFDNGVVANLWHNNIYHRYRECIGYMPQEAYLSNTSLAVNIALETEFQDQDVMQAIRLAELDADIAHWSDGLSEEVGETGVNLSGGQKQRVNLARALYSGRDYLVLDDPLSAVDSDTEAVLMQNLLTTPSGFLLCSHRLSELKNTHRLLVMDGGRITEDGEPVSLINNPQSEFSQHLRAGEFGEELSDES